MDFETEFDKLIELGYSANSSWIIARQKHFAEKTFSNYPKSISNNAKRGIELNQKVNNKCATQVGKVRAQQLANGEKLSLSTIKRMYSYLSRAETYYDPNNMKSCGTISYLLWGGLSAKSWSHNILIQEGEITE